MEMEGAPLSLTVASRMNIRRLRLAGALGLAASLSSCGVPAPSPTSVVLVSIDTLRSDHLGCYGYGRETSPQIDRLCSESVVFDQALAHAPSTLLSHAALFTSLVPQHHGASHIRSVPLPESTASLPERFARAGFRTAGFHGLAQMAPEYGFGRGFESYEPRPGRLSGVVGEALAWLDGVGDSPFFLFLHTYDVHHPYEPAPESLRRFETGYDGPLPPTISIELLDLARQGRVTFDEADRRHIVATYDAEIFEMDAAVGALLDGLRKRGRLDKIVFALVSDHGEEFAEHGVMGWHSHTLYQELLRVPLIVRLPGGRGGGLRVADRVGLIDVGPTLLEGSGLAPDAGEGHSLLPLVNPVSPAAERLSARLARRPFLALGEIQGRRFDALLLGSRKLYESALFDLGGDPGERHDLAGADPRQARAMRELLDQLGRSAARPAGGSPLALDSETEQSLRALGYL